MPQLPGRAARAFLAAAFAWTLVNAVYVYLVLDGARLFRLETALFIFAAAAALALAFNDRRAFRHADLSAGTTAVLAVGVAAAWLAIFLPLIRFPLLSEDYGFRARSAELGVTLSTGQFFRPVFMLAFSLLDRIGGRGSPVPLHLAALVVHGISAGLTAVLGWRLLRRRDVGLLAFTLFLLNPAQLEATLWVSGLQEQLWTTALLAALVVYTSDPRLTPVALLATALLVALALLSKESAVAALLLLPAADGVFYRWRRGPWLMRGYAALVLLVMAYLAVRGRFVTIESTFLVVPSQFFLKQFVSVTVKTLAQPWNVEAVAIPLWIALVTALAPAALLATTIWRGRGDWRLLLGPALMLGSVLPVYSYFFVDGNLMSSRYVYFAAAGWALLLADLIVRALPSRVAVVGALGAALVLGTVTLQLNLRPWRTVGAMVTDMQSRLAAGEPADSVVASWRERLGEDLKMRDGIPRSYRGVFVFENGWMEFVEQRNSELRVQN